MKKLEEISEDLKKQNEKKNEKLNREQKQKRIKIYDNASNCNDLLEKGEFIEKETREIANNIGNLDSKRDTEINENYSQFGSTNDWEKNKNQDINTKVETSVKKPLDQNENKKNEEKTKDLNLNNIDKSKNSFPKCQSSINIKVNLEEEGYLDIKNNNAFFGKKIKTMKAKNRKNPFQEKNPSKINNINDNKRSNIRSKGFIPPLDKKETSLKGNENKDKKDIIGYLNKKRITNNNNNFSNRNEKPRSRSRDENIKHDQDDKKENKLTKGNCDNISKIGNNLPKNSHQLETEEKENDFIYWEILNQKRNEENNILMENLQNISIKEVDFSKIERNENNE